jgi:ribosomal protein L3 glutamine methyltransferase
LALASGSDGLDFTRKLLADAADYLTEHGILVVEVGNSMEAVEELWPNVPFVWVEFTYGGHGVFLLTREQLIENRDVFVQAL